MPFGLTEHVVQSVSDILRRHPQVEAAVLYGSRAMGTFRPNSDIDLALQGSQLNLTILRVLANELDDLLLPIYFDLSIFDQIDNAPLRDHISRVGIPLYLKKM